jgi:hypothetical protein
MTRFTRRVPLLLVAILWPGLIFTGCQRPNDKPPPPLRTFAVVPFLNQSGSEFLDPIAVTDEFYTELQLAEGLHVVPVNRVLAALSKTAKTQISSPDEAVALLEALDADGIIVGSVTQYDPYPPPKVGMAVQLYHRETPKPTEMNSKFIHPGDLARHDRPFEAMVPGEAIRPRVAVVRIYDADQTEVIEKIKHYAKKRSGLDRPIGWRNYTTSRKYLRFVSHEIIREMLIQEQERLEAEARGE